MNDEPILKNDTPWPMVVTLPDGTKIRLSPGDKLTAESEHATVLANAEPYSVNIAWEEL